MNTLILKNSDIQRLVDCYKGSLDCTDHRQWEKWPFHRIYNPYTEDNGGVPCVEKWREIVDAHIAKQTQPIDFDKLYNDLSELAKGVKGIGKLHIYDTAICFAKPTKVYIHSGAKEGAKAILGLCTTATVATFAAKHPELAELTPLQLEDFLCVFKDVLKGEKGIEEKLDEISRYISICGKKGGGGTCCCRY
jgi:hypothetical protein